VSDKEIWEAVEVEEIAKILIPEFHKHLEAANIKYLFQDKASSHGGLVTIAKASKSSPIHRSIHKFDFIIIVGKDIWETLNDTQRKAVIDHELCHCIKGNFDNWCTTPHDCEEFVEVIERYGEDAVAIKKLLNALKKDSSKE